MTPLSRREWLALCLLTAGASRVQIALSLDVTENTARSYVKRMYVKLGVHNRVQAMLLIDKVTRPIPASGVDMPRPS